MKKHEIRLPVRHEILIVLRRVNFEISIQPLHPPAAIKREAEESVPVISAEIFMT